MPHEPAATLHDDGHIYVTTTRHDAASARRCAAELLVLAEYADAAASASAELAAESRAPVTGADPDTSPRGFELADQPAPKPRAPRPRPPGAPTAPRPK